ncbi:MAG TPA: tRNA pseudouridine(38-40) synthase TruA [Bacillota bacterium]|nr:tRNA pseudouridine(38-40) synthase TruA [Bacillota bacterium]
MNIRLVIEYDGSSFCGWQIQPGQRSVQGLLQSAIQQVTGEEIKLHGSGRTDAGVHALGQVASFVTEAAMPAERFGPAINRRLPSDVRVMESALAPDDFHARYSAVAKTYVYKIVQAEVTPPLQRHRAWAIRQKLDLDLMREALAPLVGTHDFRALCASGSSVENTVRTVTYAGLDFEPQSKIISITIRADGFLYNMVRIIAAACVRVGMGKLPPGIFTEALATGRRSVLPFTAPPQGLYLVSVDYEASGHRNGSRVDLP